MKVLHINSNYLYTTLHGKLVESLNKNDITNTVYMATHGERKFVVSPEEYVYHPTCFKKSDRYIFFYKQKKIYTNLKKTINIKSHNLLHAHTLFTDGYIANKLYNEYHIPYVVAVRNTDVNVFFKKRILLRKKGLEILKNAKKIIFISKAYQDVVLNKYVPKEFRDQIAGKSVVIPNGIDQYWLNNKFETRKNINPTALNLIFAGRIDKNKNIGSIIKACEILKGKGIDVHLTVVGKIEDNIEYENINKYNFVTYIPKQTREKLLDLYRSNDIFVMPSKTETFGLVYAEAMSQGLPIIYTEGQGFDGQFEEGTVGYHVNSQDPIEIAKKIEEIVKNYHRLSSNCVKLCDQFNWSDISKSYLTLYKNVMENK